MADYFKVVYSRELSSEYEPRYIVIQPKTGAVLDDAQGFGYTSREKAAKSSSALIPRQTRSAPNVPSN